MSRKQLPEINAGSMADIAFLLLIFFLVTTTLNVDSEIIRKLSKQQENVPKIINDRNILEVNINKNNKLFVDGKIIKINELRQIAINFIDNGAGLDIYKKPCYWCQGKKEKNSSDHPSKAFISLKTDRTTSYETYISVLDILNSSYTNLRNKLSVKMYHKNYVSLLDDLKKDTKNKKSIEQKINTIRDKYPLLISDAEINN